MKKSILVSLSFLLILGFGISVSPTPPANAAGDFYVPSDYPTIQSAIDAAYLAGGSTTIHVAPGVYEENLLIGPSSTVTELEIVGSGAHVDDIEEIKAGGVSVTGTVLSGSVIIGVDYSLSLRDFSIFNGSGTGIEVYSSSPAINECIIAGVGYEYGGAMSNVNSSPRLTNCMFYNCSAKKGGGGMYNSNSSPTLVNCTFWECFANWGGGMFNRNNSSPKLLNCVFYRCKAYITGWFGRLEGGGMYNVDSSPILTNCTFFRCWKPAYSDWRGDSIFNYGDSSPVLTNCILWRTAPKQEHNDHIFGGTPTVTYCCIKFGLENGWDGEGNIYSDPLIVEDVDNFCLYLHPESPCIDAGKNDAVPGWLTTDFEGDPRIFNGTVDMGHDEFVPEGAMIIAAVDLDPNTLNKKSKGNWITAYIGLPAGYEVNDIDINTVELQYNGSSVAADRGDVQGTVLMVKFSKQELITYLGDKTGNVTLTVSGALTDGTPFEGSDTIKVK